jgi:hypothetical protein|tara:strand:- start:1381 stop:1842 length:462 start_codon:yes stop_codon:yes gene_type:complete
MIRNITLDNDKIKHMLSSVFDDDYKDSVLVDALLNMLSDSSIDMLIHIMFKPDYELLSIGDYVKFKPSKYDFNADVDTMIDLGIMKDGYMYGEVLKDTSYGSDFNPTYYKMLLNTITLNDDGTVIRQDHEVNTIQITKIDKKDIKYLSYEKKF